MDQRDEFVRLASVEGASMAALCRRYGISRTTGYRWLGRFKAGGAGALADQSRRPRRSPGRMGQELEDRVVALRREHRGWGGRKIAARLKTLGCPKVPSASAITRALHRHELIDPGDSYAHRAKRRFEYPFPNDLWQMDFKGHFALGDHQRCHPLTVLDDHSRFAVVLQACANEQTQTVRDHLIKAFERYGMPRRVLCDNGAPWGTAGRCLEDQWTTLSVWLLRLGVGVIHGHPHHPQTQGKEERFHGTLKRELLRWQALADMPHAQRQFDDYRQTYNHIRPHEALGMEVPGERYTISPRAYPGVLPVVEYDGGDVVRRVNANGRIRWGGGVVAIGKPFIGELVALRATRTDGHWEVYYCQERIGLVDEKTGEALGPRACHSLAALANGTPAS